jgi:hypothetical protein
MNESSSSSGRHHPTAPPQQRMLLQVLQWVLACMTGRLGQAAPRLLWIRGIVSAGGTHPLQQQGHPGPVAPLAQRRLVWPPQPVAVEVWPVVALLQPASQL